MSFLMSVGYEVDKESANSRIGHVLSCRRCRWLYVCSSVSWPTENWPSSARTPVPQQKAGDGNDWDIHDGGAHAVVASDPSYDQAGSGERTL